MTKTSPSNSPHLIKEGATVREALSRLNLLSGANMTLFVVDGEGRLVGSLTDGDIRRALAAGSSLDAPADGVCNRGCLRICGRGMRYEVAKEARRRCITLLPVVDPAGKVVQLIDMRGVKALLPLDAVLMAGGQGQRLRPLTLTTPKPLLPVGGKAIIDHNIEALASYGVDNIFVTVNYLKEQLQAHFAPDGGCAVPGVCCVEEPCRLGTMGSLALVEGLREDDVLVMNSDLLTNIDFARMFERHRSLEADLTVAVTQYKVDVPFAVVAHDGDRVIGLQEKPTYNFLANAGIYIMKRSVADSIPGGEYLDAPDLIEQLIAAGRRVAYYPIEGTWTDIGNPDDYRAACERFSS